MVGHTLVSSNKKISVEESVITFPHISNYLETYLIFSFEVLVRRKWKLIRYGLVNNYPTINKFYVEKVIFNVFMCLIHNFKIKISL